MPDLSEATQIKLTIAKFITVLALAAGFMPWLQAHTRGIVREEMEKQVVIQREWDRRWNAWEHEKEASQARYLTIRETLTQILTELKYLRPLVGR